MAPSFASLAHEVDAAVELGDNDARTELIADRSAYLVDRAKAELAAPVGDDDRAATLLERWAVPRGPARHLRRSYCRVLCRKAP